MHEGQTQPFEDMTREELIIAATFWRSEYERVVRESTSTLEELATALTPHILHNVRVMVRTATDGRGI